MTANAGDVRCAGRASRLSRALRRGRLGAAAFGRSRGLPAALSSAPLAAGAVRTLGARGAIWLWGDQAVIDVEARNSLLGRDLLGVYDRYGWHHPGPLWLLLLGLFRWGGGGSAAALVFGSYAVQAAAAASVVLVAARLRPGLTAWWAALLVVCYEWDFGPQRLGTVWAPYAVALPVALLVLLAADAISNAWPWPAWLGLVVCGSFLVQTDVGTGVVVVSVVAVAGVWSIASRAKRASVVRRRWRLRAGVLACTALATWLPPLVQQLSAHVGNLSLLARFFLHHRARHSWDFALRALGTVFGSFPLLRGRHGASLDAKLTWLAAAPLRRRPWYLAYLAGTAATSAAGALRRRREAAVLGGLSLVALVAGGLSVKLAYGPPFPYLVIWVGALSVPAWVAAWLAFAPSRLPPLLGRAVPLAGGLACVAVLAAFAAGPFPMSGTPALLGRASWSAVAAQVSSPTVRTVLVDIDGRDAMPEGAAIVDAALRHGRRVEVDRAALYFFDPSLAPRPPVQLKVLVCCGRGDPGRPQRGLIWRARVGGQSIYTQLLSSGRAGTAQRAVRRLGGPAVRVLGRRYGADVRRVLGPDQ